MRRLAAIETPLPNVVAGLGGLTTVDHGGEFLFDHFHHDRRVTRFGFAHQQVEMLRHHYVTDDHEAVAHLLQDLQEEVAAFRGAQPGHTVVTAAGDEMRMMDIVVSLEAARRS